MERSINRQQQSEIIYGSKPNCVSNRLKSLRPKISNQSQMLVSRQKFNFDCKDKFKDLYLDENINQLIKILEQENEDYRKSCDFLYNNLILQIQKESEATQNVLLPHLEQSKKSYQEQNYQNAIKSLCQIFQEQNPLDLQKITDQISKSLDFSKDIIDQQIVMFLGFTGAGKSTLIHYLSGSEIKQITTDDGLRHWEPSNPNPQYQNLDYIVSKADAKSETKFVIPVQIRTKDQNQYGEDDKYILCDTPGFHDTDGKESEIANLTAITKCISVCQSIKPVVVISEKQISDRGQGIKNIASVIKRMVQPSQKFHQIVSKFLFVFTKYNQEEDRKELCNKLKNIQANLTTEEKNDQEFVSVLSCMLKQTSNTENIIFFDLSLKGYEFLEQYIKDRKPILNPKEVFTCFLTPEAETVMDQQLKIDQIRIQTALSNKNFILICKKMNQLLVLRDNINDLSIIKFQWEQNENLINQYISNQKKDVEEIIKQMINSRQIEKEYIDHFLRTKQQFEQINILQKLFPQVETLIKQFDGALEEVNVSILEEVQNEQICMQQNNLNGNYKKLLVLSEFQNENNYVKKFQDIVKEKLENLLQNSQNCLETQKFKDFFDEIGVVINLVQNLEFMQVCDLQNQIEKNLNQVINIINDLKEQLMKYLQEKNYEDLQDNIVSTHDSIKNIFKQFNESKLIDEVFKQKINAVSEQYTFDIEQLFTSNENKLNNIIKDQSNEFKGLKQQIQFMRLLSKLSTILESKFDGLINKINNRFDKIFLDGKQTIKELAHLSVQADLDSKFENVEEILQLIQKFQWIQEYDQDKNLDSQQKEIFNLLKKFASQIVRKLDQIEISLNQTEDLSNIEGSNLKINKLKKFEDRDEQLKNIIEEYEKEVRKKFEVYFQNTEKFLQENSDSYYQYEKYFLFLDQCQRFKIYKQEVIRLIDGMQQKLITSAESKKEILKKSIDSLKKIFEISSLTEENRNQVEQISKLIYEKFDDMLNIEKHNYIKFLLKDKMSEYQIDVQHYQLKKLKSTINERIQKESHVANKWIFILQHLKQIDDLEYKSQPLSSFSDLLSSSYKKNNLKILSLKNRFEQKLNQNHVPQILQVYLNVKETANQNQQDQDNQLILDDLQFQIENEIKKNLNSAKQYIDKLKQIITLSPISHQYEKQRDNSNQIVFVINNYEEYVSHFENHLDLNKFKTTFGQIQNSINQIANEVPQKIQQTFRHNNFKESFDQSHFMQDIFQVLQQKFDIGEKLEQISKVKDDCFNELQQKVESLKLDNPRTENFDLKYISSCLEQVEDKRYREFSTKIKQIYQKKLEERLTEARNLPIQQQEEIIQEIEQCFDYIPKEIKNVLGQEIDNLKKNSKAKQEIDDLFKNKDIQELKKVLETLKNTSQYKEFNERLANLIETESEQSFQKIMQNSKQYIENKKSLLNLMKISAQSPKEFQQKPKERLNQSLGDIYCFPFKQADNKIDNILSKVSNRSIFDLQHYSQQNNCLLEVITKLEENELKDLKQTVNSFYIVDSIEKQKQKVENSLSTKIKQLQENQQDFQNMMDSFNIIAQLKCFDYKSYILLPKIYNQRHNEFQKKVETVINKNIAQFKYENEYKIYYERFQKGVEKAENMQKIANEIDYSNQVNLVYQLQQKLKLIVDEINQIFEQCLQENILDEQVSSSVNNVFLNSKYIGEYLPKTQNKIDKDIIQVKVKQKIQVTLKKPVSNSGIQEIKETSQYISDLHKLSTAYIYMDKVKAECDESINQALTQYKKQQGSIEKLQVYLRQNSKYGDQITKNHPFFKGFQISDTNLKLQRLDMIQILDKIKGYFGQDKKDDLNKKQIEYYNQLFLKKYNSYLEKYLNEYDKIDFVALLKDIQKSVYDLEFQENGIIEQTSLGGVPDLLAGIFTCWTCLNSKYYFESKMQKYDKQETFLLKPTHAQLAAIFRLLGIGYSTKYDQMQPNNLAQVLTGEGKSVILAALSSFYALCGFSVKCACYSYQLSTRDYQDFSPLFEKLKIKDPIFYGTFNKVCEQILNDRGDIREQISNFIQSDKIQFKDASNLNKQVLLIDEVDIFFSKEFFGNNYDIVAPIQDETVEKLLDKIWNQKALSNFSFKSISESNQFKQCLAKFPQWSELIQEQVKIVVQDFKSFKDIIVENYIIENDKICYKNQDQYVDNISYGYRTLYSYYQEKENNKISEVGLKRQKMFKINCGSFSYSELPKKFLMIKGVTGTLETLSKSQLELIQKSYNINQYTLVPSVYGDSKFIFDKEKDVKVVSQQEYFINITNEISKNMVGKSSEENRAVLVFFSTKENLMEYHDSEYFKGLKTNFKIQIMTEENTIEERKQIIQDATYSGTITLMTRIFCRGIDFRVLDTVLFQNHGIHVIQTFFSEDKSEEIQAKGRTARQGEEGSYSMILDINTLQAFLKSDEEKQKMSQNSLCYDVIDSIRQTNFENDFKSNMEYNQKASITNHKQSDDFLALLKNSKQEEVKKYLLKLNQGQIESTISKTLIALDATGSMRGLITQAKNTIQTTFEQARDILQDKGYDPQCFLVMISIFRSYSNKWDEIFQTTKWENNADQLRSFLQGVKATGGTNPGEAVEVGLWWANKQNDESPINQVIVLGDQPANLKDEAQEHRNKLGQSYWDKTPLKGVSYYEPECNKLQKKSVPVHTFYLHNRAKKIYKKISQITGGQSDYLDILSDKSAKILTDILVEQILNDIGKQDGRSEELVMAYRAKYS